MALKNLTTTEMIWLTGSIVSAEGLRPRFEEVPLLAAQLPGIEHVHRQVSAVSTQAGESAVEKELAALSAEGNDLDVNHHDRLVRAIFYALLSAAEVTPSKSAVYDALSKRLLPQGLGTSQQTWMGEGGNATRIEAELAADKDLRAELKSVTLPDKHTLLDVTQEFVRAGARLGAIEHRRNELRGDTSAASAADDRAAVTSEVLTVASARNDWIATINALSTTLRLPKSGVDPATRDKVFTLIGEAEKRADLRSRRATAKVEPTDGSRPIDASPVIPPSHEAPAPRPA